MSDMPLSIPFRRLTLTTKIDTALEENNRLLLLGHGANGGMGHPLMEEAATALSERGTTVVRFNFPYREEGKKTPNSDTVLEECWEAAITAVRREYPEQSLFIGGKSLGGRTAAQFVNRCNPKTISGMVFLGFPLHAPGQPGLRRGAIIYTTGLPCFLAQGSRDALACIDLVRKLVEDNDAIQLFVVEGGDHSLRGNKEDRNALTELWETLGRWFSDRQQ